MRNLNRFLVFVSVLSFCSWAIASPLKTVYNPILGGPDYVNSTTNPSGVSDGGTGASSFTPYAVLTGGTTSTGPIQSLVAPGAAGTVLTSNGAGALPTFQAGGGGGGITIGTTAITSGTDTRVLFDDGGKVGESAGLTYVKGTSTLTAGQLVDSGLTANTALTAHASKQLTSSATTDTELGYVSGVTSAIQTQLNAKQATITWGAGLSYSAPTAT